MSHLRHSAWSIALALALAAMGASAQTAAEHEQHHPNTPAAGKPSGSKGTPAPQAGNAKQMAAMDNQMKAMREMHDKMVSAKTPEERSALMAEHMKTLQEGMAMMDMMGGAGMGAMGGMQDRKSMPGDMNQRQQMMEKRMEMMQSMMQMMMDRLPPPAAK